MKDRVRLVWWYPSWPQVTTPLGMALILVMDLFSESAVSLIGALAATAIWTMGIIYHYAVRRQDLQRFWDGLYPDWEEKARAQGWDPERALAVYVHLYNSRHYTAPVVRLVSPPEKGP